jgi:hypothetical protein
MSFILFSFFVEGVGQQMYQFTAGRDQCNTEPRKVFTGRGALPNRADLQTFPACTIPRPNITIIPDFPDVSGGTPQLYSQLYIALVGGFDCRDIIVRDSSAKISSAFSVAKMAPALFISIFYIVRLRSQP